MTVAISTRANERQAVIEALGLVRKADTKTLIAMFKREGVEATEEQVQEALVEDGVVWEKAGDAILKAAMRALLDRDWYVATTDTRSTYGLYATRDAAVKAAKNNEFGEPAGVAIVRVLSAQKRADYVRSQA